MSAVDCCFVFVVVVCGGSVKRVGGGGAVSPFSPQK